MSCTSILPVMTTEGETVGYIVFANGQQLAMMEDRVEAETYADRIHRVVEADWQSSAHHYSPNHTHGLASWDHNHGDDNYHEHSPKEVDLP